MPFLSRFRARAIVRAPRTSAYSGKEGQKVPVLRGEKGDATREQVLLWVVKFLFHPRDHLPPERVCVLQRESCAWFWAEEEPFSWAAIVPISPTTKPVEVVHT